MDPRQSQHNQPVPQKNPLFCKKKKDNGKLGQAGKMSLQMESWFLQAVHPRGECLVLPSVERHQRAHTGPSDHPQQDLAPVKYCTWASFPLGHGWGHCAHGWWREGDTSVTPQCSHLISLLINNKWLIQHGSGTTILLSLKPGPGRGKEAEKEGEFLQPT